MARLIDADALKDYCCELCDNSASGYTIEECRNHGCGFMSAIDRQPTIGRAEPPELEVDEDEQKR